MTETKVKESPVREIAIIGGTGEQGFGLALRWAQAGERILIGSRDKDKAERAAQKLRPSSPDPVVKALDDGASG